jgi:hypothetical protein
MWPCAEPQPNVRASGLRIGRFARRAGTQNGVPEPSNQPAPPCHRRPGTGHTPTIVRSPSRPRKSSGLRV